MTNFRFTLNLVLLLFLTACATPATTAPAQTSTPEANEANAYATHQNSYPAWS